MNPPGPAKSAPGRHTLTGRYCRLEPLGPQHVDSLYAASSEPGAADRFAYLFDQPPADRADLAAWIEAAARQPDPLFFVIIDRSNETVVGRQAFMRIVPEHGVIEIGSIYWSLAMARTRLATEALYLFARHAFDDLGYRRFEWKCDNRNEPSKRAARRFGFRAEGLFRQHMIIKGQSRDTAWFSIVDAEWPALRAEYDRWLDPRNFDADGGQLTPLQVPSDLS